MLQKVRLLSTIVVLLTFCHTAAWGAPFAGKTVFTQPDGTEIVLWGEGDEFYAVFETLDGYTVVFNPQTRAYDYAALSSDGDQLVSTGLTVGRGSPSALGVAPHLRISPKAARMQAAQRFARWDQAMEVSRRWKELKAGRRLAEQSASVLSEGPEPSPPAFTTTGLKVGLTLLIDFSDAVGTVPQAEIINFCNGDNYTGYGNNGSVKKYYRDNSNNLLTYTNVVTVYIRAPQPKTYYNDTTVDCGVEGRLLINETVAAMKALPNYTTEILPAFANLTVDGSSRVVAFNVFFAGANSGVWSYGLWPHSWSLASSIDLGNGKKAYKYQITNIGSSLQLGTFCHENGHMLCGFPDIYDYDYDSRGGAGAFCLMDFGGSGGNPVQISAYLKRAAGWATTVGLTSASLLTASVSSSGAEFNKFYRYPKPGVSTEYFLVENRQKSGRDANLPAAGIAIWHIDELGDKDNQSTNFNTSHLNYEVSLMQADNLWHFQNDVNTGDSKDLYYLGNTAAGYSNRFNDATSPSARWWDGSASGIRFHHFSASGTTMTFGVGPEGPLIALDSASLGVEGCLPGNGAVDPNETVTFSFSLKNVGGLNTSNLVVTLLATNGVVSPSGPQLYGTLVTNGAAASRPFTFTAAGTCGGTLTAVLQLQDGASNLGTLSTNFALGAPGGSPVTSTYSSGGVAVAVSDNTTVEVPVTIADPGTVADVNVRVRLNHTYDGDLALSLIHPDGTLIALANNRGSSGDNFGSGAADCSGTFTVFDDAAGTAISGGTAPFAGSYRPDALLSTLNGKPLAGTWKLRVADTAVGDVGTIYCFQLEISRQLFACCTASTDLGVAMTAVPDPVLVGQDLTYLLTATNLGPEPAFNVTLTDSLPANVTFVSASPGCAYLSGKVIASAGILPSGGATNFTVVVTPNAGGWATNVLTVASFTPDSNPANDSVTNITTVNAPPWIVAQPACKVAVVGTNVTFQVAATGTAPLGYQWRCNGTNVPGASSSTLALTNVQVEQAGSYAVLVTNDFGSALSSDAVLVVLDPWITVQPQSQFIAAGAAAALTVGVAGTPPLAYQWLKGGLPLLEGPNLAGTREATLTLASFQAGDMGNYSVVVSNLNGWVVSSNALLTGPFPPLISAQPVSRKVNAGAVAALEVEVIGPSPVSFRWRREGTNLSDGGKLSGTAAATLMISNVQAGEVASYSVAVSNSYGQALSANALVSEWPLAAWGYNNYGQTEIPAGLSNVLAIASGYYHALALKADGTVAAWGAGTNYTGILPSFAQAVVPGDLTDVVGIAAGGYHSLALKADGTVAAWGAGTNYGASPRYGQAVVPAGLTNVQAIAAGIYHSLALKRDGTVVAWGAGATNTGVSPHFGQALVPEGLSNVVAIACGSFHNLALKADGTVVAWGAGASNPGTSPHFGQAMVPADLTDAVAVSCGSYCSLAARADGSVVAWGSNTSGQTNVPAGLSNVVAVAAGLTYGLALRNDGTLVGWGSSTYGQTNIPPGVENVVAIGGGGFYELALQNDGRPCILLQPVSQVAAAGNTVTFRATAVGAPSLSYQWQRSGTNLPGATTSALTLALVQVSDADAYRLVVGNSLGSAQSSAATLVVNDTVPPTIACPADILVPANAGCNATNVALGTPAVGDSGGIAMVTNNAPESYPPGTNLVTWTAVDWGGNTNSCQQHVIVADTEAPAIAWHLGDLVLAAGANCQIPMPDLTGTNGIWVTDNCSSVTVTQSMAPGTLLSLGTNAVVLGAFDAGGNASFCTNSVAVVVAPPLIVNQPASQMVVLGGTASFSVTAVNECAGPFAYQWRFLGFDIPGATASSYTRTDVQRWDAGAYSVMVSNAVGTTGSLDAVLTVGMPPSITSQPLSQTVKAGSNVWFSVVAQGAPPPTYQWRFNGLDLAGQTANVCLRTNVQAEDCGSYSVVVSNAVGVAASVDAVLSLLAPGQPFLDAIWVLPDGQIRLQGSGSPGHYAVEGTTNFLDWVELTNFITTTDVFFYTEADTNLTYRCYRTRLIP